jgi:hypothetical protein
MSVKTNSTRRSPALLGAAAAALVTLLPVATMAQGLPGARQQGPYYRDQGFAPRPDFPGAKQSGTAHQKMTRSKHSQKD